MPAAAANADRARAREAREGRIEQGGQDLAHAVGAEVEAEQAVAVAHAAVVADHGRQARTRRSCRAHRHPRSPPRRPGTRGPRPRTIARVGLVDALPALVAVHGVVAPAHGRDRHAGGSAAAKRAQVLGGRARRRVAAVGEGVDAPGTPASAGSSPAPPRGPGANARRRARRGRSGGTCRRSRAASRSSRRSAGSFASCRRRSPRRSAAGPA